MTNGTGMNDKIAAIRSLLDELERDSPSAESERVLREYSAFELPEIINDIVDYLVPLTKPYEAAFYWHMFRHSIMAAGEQYARISTRGLTKNVVYSTRGGGDPDKRINLDTVRQSLQALETLGAIRKEGEPNRDGILYKILIPEEIEACREAMKDRQTAEHKTVDVDKEIDFYNVRESRHKIFERDSYKCAYCDKQLTRFTATLDHVTPVSAGGDNSYDNVITACLQCNSQKTGKPLGDFLADRDRQRGR